MHPSVMAWVSATLTPEKVAGKTVLEVGSYDVNGSVRPLIAPHCKRYLGVDAAEGPGVDEVADCENLCAVTGYGEWDLVVSTEMLEHVNDWRACLNQMAWTLRPGGLLVLTTRSPGFPYHPFPQDNWRYTKNDMTDICYALGFERLILEDDPEAPGVFLMAAKPLHWKPASPLDDIAVAGVEAGV